MTPTTITIIVAGLWLLAGLYAQAVGGLSLLRFIGGPFGLNAALRAKATSADTSAGDETDDEAEVVGSEETELTPELTVAAADEDLVEDAEIAGTEPVVFEEPDVHGDVVLDHGDAPPAEIPSVDEVDLGVVPDGVEDLDVQEPAASTDDEFAALEAPERPEGFDLEPVSWEGEEIGELDFAASGAPTSYVEVGAADVEPAQELTIEDVDFAEVADQDVSASAVADRDEDEDAEPELPAAEASADATTSELEFETLLSVPVPGSAPAVDGAVPSGNRCGACNKRLIVDFHGACARCGTPVKAQEQVS